MRRVQIGTCGGPAEAALVRAAFEAHRIPFVINAEQHASMLGGLGGAFVPLHVFVDEADAEAASALLAELRTGVDDEEALAAEAEAAGSSPELAIKALPDESDDDDSPQGVGPRLARRRRIGVALLLGLCVTFGTAHMYVGAWLRGFLLALIETFAITQTVADRRLGVLLLLACIAVDLVGALRALRPGGNVPSARVVR